MIDQNQGRGAAYRKLAKGRVATEEVTLPSGAVFLLRKPEMQLFALSGALPAAATAKMEAAQRRGRTAEEAFAELAPAEQLEAIAFGRKLLVFCCVSPRLVTGEPQSDDELSIEDLEPADLTFLVEWANRGGATADAVNFRSGSDPVAGADRPKHRNAAK